MFIKKIKELGFYINDFLIQDASLPVQFEIGLQLSFTLETNTVYMMVRVYEHYPDAPNDQILADIQVQHIFGIPDLHKFQTGPAQFLLSGEMISSLVSLSVSHTRALLSKHTAGTGLQDNILPIINPEELSRQFFPEMFSETFY